MQRLLVITPCLNAEQLLDDTIMSVVTQGGDFALHYHVQDGGSRDGTVQKLETWARRLAGDWPRLCTNLVFSFRSDHDDGLYDAINRGFAVAHDLPDNGMMTWINAGDRLAQGALQTVTAVRREFADAEWLSGSFAQINDEGCPIVYGAPAAISAKLASAGLHDGRRLGALQQEGVFWSHSLWRKAGGSVNTKLKLAGDFDLWRRFAQHAPCHVLHVATGFFRRHSTGLSSDVQGYCAEVAGVLTGEAANRRDTVLREYTELVNRRDPNSLANAGFMGPIVVWNWNTGRWERKIALVDVSPST
ncbi:MAG: glycosyltransferase [Gammaproteobacteria bacterium]|nr:glycosyltransferase [Gammaproteobacteria bacterium]